MRNLKVLQVFSDFLGKYFILIILSVAVLAIFFSESFISIGKIRILGQSPVILGLGTIMFIMGLSVKKEDWNIVWQKPREIFIGCLAQFTIMPLLAFILAKLFELPPALAVGLVLLGTCPGGTASNVMTYLAKGDVALSVGMTTVSTLLAPILAPTLTYAFAGQWIEIHFFSMVFDILKIVLLPVSAGMLIQHFFADFIHKIQNILVIIPIVSIVIIMGLCVAPNKENLLHSGYLLVLAVCLHNWFGFLLGYIVGRYTNMNLKQTKALSIEVGLQNSGLAIGLSAQFSNPLCALPATIATVIHQISGSVLANVFSGNIPAAKTTK